MSNDSSAREPEAKPQIRFWGVQERVTRGGTTIQLPRKTHLLLAMGALAERSELDRDSVCHLLWENAATGRRQHSLKQTLFELRRRLPEITPAIEGARVILNWENVKCDIREFRLAAARGDAVACAQLFTGSILEDVELTGILARWREDTNDRLKAIWGEYLGIALRKLSGNNEWAKVEEIARKALTFTEPPYVAYEAYLTSLLMQRKNHLINQTLLQWRTHKYLDPVGGDLQQLVSRFEALSTRMGPSPSFVGRGSELQLLAQLLDRPSRAIVVAGEAGIGKTALIDQFVRRALVKGIPVWQTACDPRCANIPFSSISAILKQGTESDTNLKPATRQLIQYARNGDPLMSQFVQRTSYTRIVRMIAEGVSDIIQNIPNVGSCVVVVDDAHCADISSIQVLNELMEASEESKIPLVLCARVDDRGRELLHLFRNNATILNLEPLSDDNSADVIRSFELKNGINLSTDERIALVRLCAGNPLFLTELLGSARAGVRLRTAAEFPETLRENVQIRWAMLSPDAKAFLAALACHQGKEEPETVFATARLTEQTGLAAAEEAERERFVIDEGSAYSIRHEVIAEIIRESTGVVRKRVYHSRIAAGLPVSRDTAAVRAWHLEHAGQYDEAAIALIHAAEFSSDVLAQSETVRLLTHAAAIATNISIRSEAQLALARFYLRTQEYTNALEVYNSMEVATAISAVELRISEICCRMQAFDFDANSALIDLRSAARDAHLLQDTDGWINALAALTIWADLSSERDLLRWAARELLNASGRARTEWLRILALTLGGPALASVGEYEAGLQSINTAHDSVADSKNWAFKVRVQIARSYINLLAARPNEVVADLTEAVDTLRSHAADHTIASVLSNLGLAKWQAGRSTEARQLFNEGKRMAEMHRRPFDRWACMVNLALIELQEGAIAEAEQIASSILGEGAMDKAEMAGCVAWAIRGLCALQSNDTATAEIAEQVLASKTPVLQGFPEPHPIIFLSRMRVHLNECREAESILVSAIESHRPGMLCRFELILELVGIAPDYCTRTYVGELQTLTTEMQERGLLYLTDRIAHLEKSLVAHEELGSNN